MNQPETEARFQGLIEVLQGTCQSMDSEDQEWLEENDLCDRFDGEIFSCEVCGWWSEASEQSEQEDQQTCQECYEDAQVE